MLSRTRDHLFVREGGRVIVASRERLAYTTTMHILGLTGPIGHGKSAFAEAAMHSEPTARLIESGMVIAEVADLLNEDIVQLPDVLADGRLESQKPWLDHALPAALETVTGRRFDPDKLKIDLDDGANHPDNFSKLHAYVAAVKVMPEMAAHTITPENKEHYRPLLQWIGGYVTQALGYSLWYEEIIRRSQAIAGEGCTVLLVGGVRFPDDAAVLRRAGGLLLEIVRPGHLVRDIHDPTEQLRSQIPIDVHVSNDGSLEDLAALAETCVHDLKAGRLQESYRASGQAQAH